MSGINVHHFKVVWHRCSKPALALLVAALAVSLLGVSLISETLLLKREGVAADAEIVDKSSYRSGDDRTWILYLNLESSGGSPGTESLMVNRGVYGRVEVGDTVPVIYVPERPGLIRLQAQSDLWDFAVLLVAFGLAAAGIWLLRRNSEDIASAVRAARHGPIRPARVVSIQDTGWKSGKLAVVQLQWQDGEGSRGQTRRHRIDRVADWSEDSEVLICTDPESGRDWWLEDLSPGASSGAPAGHGRAES